MIALLLAAQLTAVDPMVEPPRPAGPDTIAANGIIRVIRSLPSKACVGAGRIEVNFAQPAALYRKGDRPPKLFVGWNDYPDGRFCHLGGTP